MIYLIIPTRHGHFLSYVAAIQKRAGNATVQIVVTSNIVESICFVSKLILTKNVSQIFFLHGERHLALSLLSKIFKPQAEVKVVFYYLFCETKASIFLIAKFVFLRFAIMVGVKPYSIDCLLDQVPESIRRNLIVVKDPVLLNRSQINQRENHLRPGANTLNIVVAGFVCDRKCVNELILAAAEISKKIKLSITLEVVGECDSEYDNLLQKTAKESPDVTCNFYKDRVSDGELSTYIANADVIYCVYKDHIGSSGMLINAIYLDKPALFVPVGVLSIYRRMLNVDCLPAHPTVGDIEKSLLDFITFSFDGSEWRQYSTQSRDDFLRDRCTTTFASEIFDS